MESETPMQIPDIIHNNIEGQKLCDVLNVLLLPEASAAFATAYFNIDGFALVKDKLTQVKSFRLLLGKEPMVREPLPAGEVSTITDELRADTEDAMGRRETPPLLEKLLHFLQRETVQVRLCPQFVHGKAYVVQGIPYLGEVAIHGSSNFTAAGLTRSGELNSVHKQASSVKEIKDYFESYWSKSDDYKSRLTDLLSDFTVKYSPFDIYIKALYEYFKDRFQMEAKVDGPSPIFLADFQRDGYIAAKDILETYGGVMLADSVGLGKTYLGLKLLEDYAYQLRQKALIVCPAQLRDTLWEPKLRDYAIRADIRSQEELGQKKTFIVEEFLDHDVVLIDESHNFRNSATNRYDNLVRLLTLGKTKRLILLTATPVNNSIFDLYHQIMLITRGYEDFFASAGIRNLLGYFRQVETNKDHLYDLLEEISVRRSRHYIRKNYPHAIIDGKPVNFPERQLHTVHYSLEQSYHGLYQEVADTIENLYLASYSLDTYRKDIRLQQLVLWDTLKERLIAQGKTQEEVEDLTWRLGRQVAIVHILKTLYLKRLESSVVALRISLERQAKFQEKFLEMLKRGKLLNAASYRNIFELNGTDDMSEREVTVDDLINELPEVDLEQYLLDDVAKAVKADMDALNSVLRKLPEQEELPQYDRKLHKLKKLLTGELRGKKVVVFTYFKDTSRYLYRQLNTPHFHNALGHNRISITDSDIDSKQRKDRITRFAPKANEHPHLKGTDREIDLLISTDILSEGQNLQDADTVINYDLHWNPVRMIQRAGRIDRLGSDYNWVHIYNFFPEDKLEALLKLVERLYEKLDAIKRTVGLDASTLGEAVDPREFNALRRIQAQDLSILEELERDSELIVGEFAKQELLDFLKEIGEERLKRIPLGIGSGMKRDEQHGLFVYLKGGDRHFWSYYDLGTGKMTERKLDIIKLIQCKETTPRAEPVFDVYEVIDKVKDHIVNRLRQLQVGPLTFKAPQNHILNLLQTIRSQHQIDDLIDYYSTPLPDAMLRSLRKIWDVYRRDGNIEKLLQHLKTSAEANPVTQGTVPSPSEQLQREDLKLVCWLAIV